MGRLIGGLWLCSLVVLGARQVQTWASDQALWTQAVRVNPALPRPAVNLAAAELRLGHWAAAQDDAQRAVWLSRQRSDREHALVVQLVEAQTTWRLAFGPP